jgi:lactoylglutathione lyase
MKIEHIAIWVTNLEEMRSFYEKYFSARAGEKYVNAKKGFHSYFLSFESGARLELMQMDRIPENKNDIQLQSLGLIHFAVSVGGREKVDRLTESLRRDDHKIIGEPRTTGDGYYESVVLDPEGNRIEITI